MVANDELVVVGKVGRPRGLDGSFYVTPLTDFPGRFQGLTEVYVRSRDRWDLLSVASVRYISQRPVVKLEGVDSPEEAARFTNRELAVTRENLVELPDDTFFIFDLVGCEVFDADNNKRLGTITEVEQYPANDVYVLQEPDGTELRIPAVRQYIKKVDIKARKIVAATEGLAE